MNITIVGGEVVSDELGEVGWVNETKFSATFSFCHHAMRYTAEQRAEICAAVVPYIDRINAMGLITHRLLGADERAIKFNKLLLDIKDDS